MLFRSYDLNSELEADCHDARNVMAMDPDTGSMASSSYFGLSTLTNLLATIWGGLAVRSTVNIRLSI